MTETPDSSAAPEQAPRRRSGGLGSMLLADLKTMAAGMGISGAEQMRKAALVDAIKAAQTGASTPAARPSSSPSSSPASAPAEAAAPTGDGAEVAAAPAPQVTRTTRSSRSRGSSRAAQEPAAAETTASEVAPSEAAPTQPSPAAETPPESARADAGSGDGPGDGSGEGASSRRTRSRRSEAAKADPAPDTSGPDPQQPKGDQSAQGARAKNDGGKNDGGKNEKAKNDGGKNDGGQKNDGGKNDAQRSGRNEGGKGDGAKQSDRSSAKGGGKNDGGSGGGQGNQGNQGNQGGQHQKNDGNQGGQHQKNDGNQGGQHSQNAADLDDDDESGRSRNRRRRGRDRNRSGAPTPGPGQRNEPDTTILEDDVLVPAAGILDVLDNYAFVRTTGYLPGVDDVYLSLSMVRRFGLRRGDAVVGQVRQPREGERKEKFNPMVRIDTINGAEPDASRQRPDFEDLTPLHPDERLRLETGPQDLVGRMIDLAAPIGKGQRGLIISPPKAGKTTVLKQVATAVAANNPECHLMVVLVDERPEEVTDFERSVKGEVIASTFDRPPSDHTSVAELAIERAKRLVELGHDVVVLLDGITRLGRAHNLSTTASGRILSGGVDAAALHPPKRFFGAARNIEDGGSLTILATALVESGSKMDEVIFEEFNGTASSELRLRGDLAERRLFPAVDLVRSGTRREDLLMSEQEVGVVSTLRTRLGALDGPAAHQEVLERLRATQTNIELLMALQRGR